MAIFEIRVVRGASDSTTKVSQSGGCVAIAFAPFIDGVFVDAGLSRTRGRGRIIFDPRDFLEHLLKDDDRLLRMVWYEESCLG